jgi:hypothetical protein
MDERRVRKLTSLTPLGISMTQSFQSDRDCIERFIEKTYRYHYGSTIKGHYPILMSVDDPRGRVLAAVGLRLARDEPLFLEQYLEQPVDAAIRLVLSQSVERNAIVEIGDLTSAGGGASVFLFIAVAAYLRQQSLAFAVATGTKGFRMATEMSNLSIWQAIGAQLHNPSGLAGYFAGMMMRIANGEPNRLAVKALRLASNDTVLEIGCGPGHGGKLSPDGSIG